MKVIWSLSVLRLFPLGTDILTLSLRCLLCYFPFCVFPQAGSVSPGLQALHAPTYLEATLLPWRGAGRGAGRGGRGAGGSAGGSAGGGGSQCACAVQSRALRGRPPSSVRRVPSIVARLTHKANLQQTSRARSSETRRCRRDARRGARGTPARRPRTRAAPAPCRSRPHAPPLCTLVFDGKFIFSRT